MTVIPFRQIHPIMGEQYRFQSGTIVRITEIYGGIAFYDPPDNPELPFTNMLHISHFTAQNYVRCRKIAL